MTQNAIAGFWRRIAAFVVDGLVLAAVGFALGAVVGQYFPVPGGRGAVVGFAIAGAYFTYMDSELRGGQTVGKWLLGILVVHRDGSLLSPPQAFLRYCMVGVPWFVNGAALLDTPRLMRLVTFVLSGLGLSLVYLAVFNRRTRQTLHDFVVGSFTIVRVERNSFTPLEVWPVHFVVCGAIVLACAIVPLVVSGGRDSQLTPLLAVRTRIRALPEVAEVTVFDTTNTTNKWVKTAVVASVYLKRGEVDDEALAARVAGTLLGSYPPARGRSSIVVSLSSGFSLGIAAWYDHHMFSHPPSEWEAMLTSAASPAKTE